MERGTPVRKPHTNTSDLLTWSESPPPNSSSSATASAPRSNQPSDKIGKVLVWGQITDEEAETLNKRKPCSGYKLKEMTGSKIFAEDGEDTPESGTSVRIVQQAAHGISQISFSSEEKVSPKKPTTIPEVAKQRELSGTLEIESEAKLRKQISNAKSKELSGCDIFAPPPEILPRTIPTAGILDLKESKDVGEPAPQTPAQSNILLGEEPEVKTSKKIPNQKFADLAGNDIFKGDVPPGSAEKPLSSAKLKEMSGNDIFADGKVESRGYFAGLRKPPGGESSIALI